MNLPNLDEVCFQIVHRSHLRNFEMTQHKEHFIEEELISPNVIKILYNFDI